MYREILPAIGNHGGMAVGGRIEYTDMPTLAKHMRNLIMRPLTPADTLSFKTLRLAALQAAPTGAASSYEEEKDRSDDEFGKRLERTTDKTVFGAFDGERLVGIVGIRREAMRKFQHKGFIWGVYVDPDFRGQGVSRKLLTEAIAFTRQIPGMTQINLIVVASNVAAVALYRSLGFREFGRESNSMMADGVLYDEFHMALPFAAP